MTKAPKRCQSIDRRIVAEALTRQTEQERIKALEERISQLEAIVFRRDYERKAS
jgi:hypothetical protein